MAVEYDGTNFSGFQWQPAMRTVAGVLEAALATLLRAPVKVAGAGRTDAGAHATGQVVSFSANRGFPFERLALALNSCLPDDLTVRDPAVVDAGFSARFSARERTYVYAILNRREPSSLLRHRAYHVWRPLELDAMRVAAKPFVGEHDFRAFCGMFPESGGTIRAVRRLAIAASGDLIRIEIVADGFLHRMVRAIVGTLVDCGRMRLRPEAVEAILETRNRRAAGHTAPAHGLYLAGVSYEGGYDSFAEPPVFG